MVRVGFPKAVLELVVNGEKLSASPRNVAEFFSTNEMLKE